MMKVDYYGYVKIVLIQQKKYKKIGNIICPDDFILKAVNRENDVLFLYHRIISMNFKMCR
jgi:hypothetical protein